MTIKQPKFSKAEKKRMLLSSETLEGIQFTGIMTLSYCCCCYCCCYKLPLYAVTAFVELVETVFQFHGVKFFLSETISQDPLEKFFGVQRQRGRVNENPDVQAFCKNTQAIRVIGSEIP